MLIYKQRYKPRTSRAFTKSDLTVYDSAGNTALNALTVYGKSEVVNNEIVSAGDSGSIEVETCGKNLFNSAQLDTSSSNWVFLTITLKPNTTYTMSTPDLPDSTLQDTYPELYFMLETQSAGANHKVYINHSVTKTSNANGKLKIQYRSRYNIDEPITNYSFMLVEGSIAATYEPYNGTMAVFETGTPLYGVSDTVRDVMQWVGTTGIVTKNTRKIIINNNSNVILWDEGGAGAFYVGITTPQQQIKPPTDNDTPFNGLSNVPIMSRNALINSQIVAIASNLTGINILIKIPSVTTVEDAKTYFQNNPITLIYELATPTTEQLTTAENASIAGLRTFTPQTHAQNNAQTDMTVDYTIRIPTI